MTEEQTTPAAIAEPTTPSDSAPALGDAGKAALAEERKARREAERKLAEVLKGLEADDAKRQQAELERTGQVEELKKHFETKAAELAKRAEAAEAAAIKLHRDNALRAIVAEHVRGDAVEDVMALHADRFKWNNGELLGETGSPADYFAELVKSKPFWAREQSKGYGIAGKPTGSTGGVPTYTVGDFDKMSPAKQAEIGMLAAAGKARIID
jgi:hypothetical protein